MPGCAPIDSHCSRRGLFIERAALMKGWSIGSRLTIWYSLVLSLGLILFSLAVWFSLKHQLRADLEISLRNQSKGLEEYLRIKDQDNAPRLRHEIEENSLSMPSNPLLAAYDRDGDPIYYSAPGLGELPAVAKDAGAVPEAEPVRWRRR